MSNTEKITQKIMLLRHEISALYPELLNFLNEMPVTVPNVNHPHITPKTLTMYYHSLISIKEKYAAQIILKQKQHDKI
jgi:hypothetical protein